MISALNKYTAEDLCKLGFGPEAVRLMRASWIVVPSDFGGRLWFSGKEIMEFLDSKKLPPKGVKENRRNESTFKSKQLSQKD